MERYQLNISWICNVLPAEAAEQRRTVFFFLFCFFHPALSKNAWNLRQKFSCGQERPCVSSLEALSFSGRKPLTYPCFTSTSALASYASSKKVDSVVHGEIEWPRCEKPITHWGHSPWRLLNFCWWESHGIVCPLCPPFVGFCLFGSPSYTSMIWG